MFSRHQSPELRREQIDSPENRSNFRISIFGSASDSDTKSIDLATQTARELVGVGGFKIATGGQEHGTMKAAAETAHEIALQRNRPELEPDGIAMERWEPLKVGNVQIAETLPQRLQKLIDDSDAFVSLTGGIGTFLETVNALHNTNIEKGRETYKKPTLLLDPSLKLIQMIRAIEESYGLFKNNEEMAELVFVVNSPEMARIISEIFYKKKNNLDLSEDEINLLKVHSIKDHLE